MIALLALSCALLAGSAAANGRFPRAQRLLEVHDDPNVLVLSATYGVLITADRGATWRHLCELGFAFSITLPAYSPFGNSRASNRSFRR